ncbi:MAG: transposase, partial [Cypionkella sp.]|nr:transposase [Cypionkella sp.]
APQAEQVADRFHIVQNLRMAIEEQMNLHGRATGSVRRRMIWNKRPNLGARGSGSSGSGYAA